MHSQCALAGLFFCRSDADSFHCLLLKCMKGVSWAGAPNCQGAPGLRSTWPAVRPCVRPWQLLLGAPSHLGEPSDRHRERSEAAKRPTPSQPCQRPIRWRPRCRSALHPRGRTRSAKAPECANAVATGDRLIRQLSTKKRWQFRREFMNYAINTNWTTTQSAERSEPRRFRRSHLVCRRTWAKDFLGDWQAFKIH